LNIFWSRGDELALDGKRGNKLALTVDKKVTPA